ncbi:MAG: ZIP family metal transporter, partial [Planctomycetaceae bacterium]|nr:ZIP family metal transporter [Planctomycetaceae bacterium]
MRIPFGLIIWMAAFSAAAMAAEPGPGGSGPVLPGDVTVGEATPIWSHVLLAIYCVLIVAFSLAGGWLPSVVRLTHARMQGMISFVGGLMLGIGLFHLLPHALQTSSVGTSMNYMLFGILTMFFLMRAFHVHHHGPLELPDRSGTVVADSYRHKLQRANRTSEPGHGPAGHDHDHDHAHPHHGPECRPGGHTPHHHSHVHKLSWLGIALGLALHTIIDGMLLGASVRADADRATSVFLYGLGTFLAVALHKPLDAVSITSLMAAAGWSSGWRTAVNAAFAL